MRLLKKLIVGAVAAYTAYEYLTLWRSTRPRLDTDTAPQPTGGGRIHILVPGIDETAYVSRTAEAFAALAAADREVDVWFVLTVRERHRPRTIDLLRPLVAGLERVHLLEDPARTGNKASQLNYAVAQLRARGLLDDADTVGVFDFDSQPPSDLLTWVRDRRRDNDVVQVVPVPFGALAGPPRGRLARAAVWADATAHLRRSLGIERTRLLSRGRPLGYVMGAGLFVEAGVLADAGGFPFVDDLPLGYRLSAQGRRFATVPRLNPVDVPDTFGAVMSSMVFVGRGIFTWAGEARQLWRDNAAPRRRVLALVWLGLHDSWEVTAFPWCGLVLTVTAVRGRRWSQLPLVAAFWALPPLEALVLNRLRGRLAPDALWDEPLFPAVGVSLGRRFWRTAGPVRLAGRTAIAAWRGAEPVFTATERNHP